VALVPMGLLLCRFAAKLCCRHGNVTPRRTYGAALRGFDHAFHLVGAGTPHLLQLCCYDLPQGVCCGCGGGPRGGGGLRS
jgi:hypothetical protein